MKVPSPPLRFRLSKFFSSPIPFFRNLPDGCKATLLYLAVWVAFLPLLLLRDFSPGNELRYFSLAEDALREKTFFTFDLNGVAYADKPPLFFLAPDCMEAGIRPPLHAGSASPFSSSGFRYRRNHATLVAR